MDKNVLATIREMDILTIHHDCCGNLYIWIPNQEGWVEYEVSDNFAEALRQELRTAVAIVVASEPPYPGCEDEQDRLDMIETYNNAIRKIESCLFEQAIEEVQENICCQTSICERKGGITNGA